MLDCCRSCSLRCWGLYDSQSTIQWVPQGTVLRLSLFLAFSHVLPDDADGSTQCEMLLEEEVEYNLCGIVEWCNK